VKQVSIKQHFKQDHVTRVAGERLRNMILESQKAGEPVEVDFSGIKIASTSFFDEAIAKLAEEGWDEKKLEEFLRLKGIHALDLRVLKQVCKYRGLSIR
jgi:hypothetical protein